MSDNQSMLHDFAEVLFYPADREYVQGDISRESFTTILERIAYDITHRSMSKLLITKRIKELTYGRSESTERAFPFYSLRGDTAIFLKGRQVDGPRIWLTWSSFSYRTEVTRGLSTDGIVSLMCGDQPNLLRLSFDLIRSVRHQVSEVINDYDERLAALNGFKSGLDHVDDLATLLAGNRKIRELLEKPE